MKTVDAIHPSLQYPTSFSPDGTELLYTENIAGGGAEIRTVPVERRRGQMRAWVSQSFLKIRNNDTSATFSSDGRWVAYADSDRGKYEAYVWAFPGYGTKVQVSNAGGSMPVWSRMGHELFYRTQDRRTIVARFAVEGGIFKAEKP